MNLATRLTCVQDAISFRDHLAKTLICDLSMNLKQRKLDEITAHVLGASNWNTLLGQLEKLDSPVLVFERANRFNPSINPCDILNLVEDYVEHTGSPTFIGELEDLLTDLLEAHPSFVATDLQASEMALDVLIPQLCELDARAEVVGIMVSLGIEKETFNDRDFLLHHEYMTDAQIDDAFSCMMDSQHEAQDPEMEAFRYDSSLRNSLMGFIEARDK
jgi:hypothetical protein